MKLNSFNECGCGHLIEKGEFWCDDCYTSDMEEADSGDTYLDELFLEDQLDDNGELNVDGVFLKRKYDKEGRIM